MEISMSGRDNDSPFRIRSSSSDACIISSDNQTFYVDRYLLSYVSPVFKDMYDLGTTSPSPGTPVQENIIHLAEDAETLDALFRHADPKHIQPRLTIKQLYAVIAAAQKYQMDGPLSRLRSSLTTPFILHSRSTSPSPYHQESSRPINLIVSNPLPVAVLAHTFNFYEELRMALRELARAHLDIIIRNEQDCILPAEIFQYILQLRRQRNLWLKTKAKMIFSYPIPSPPSPSPASSGLFGTTTPVVKYCPHCMRHRALHIHEACLKFDDQPNWDTFKSEIQRDVRCSCDTPTMPISNEKFSKALMQWEEEARLMEAELPAWPPVYA